MKKEYPWGPWKVLCNPMSEKRYEVYRKRDDGEPMNGGNIEVHSTYFDRGTAEAAAQVLNEAAGRGKAADLVLLDELKEHQR